MRCRVTSYRDLETWQEAMLLARDCYRVTAAFPRSEMSGLTSQIRRAAASIPANVAEGHRRTRPGFIVHLRIATGSHAELGTHVELAVQLGLMNQDEARPLELRLATVGRLLHGLLRSLQVARS